MEGKKLTVKMLGVFSACYWEEVLTFGRKLTYEEYYAIYRKVLPDRLLEKISLISGMP